MPETITLDGPTLSEEQVKAMNAALDRRNDADYRAYLLMLRMIPYLGCGDWEFCDEIEEIKEEAEEIKEERERANDEFARIVTGRA